MYLLCLTAYRDSAIGIKRYQFTVLYFRPMPILIQNEKVIAYFFALLYLGIYNSLRVIYYSGVFGEELMRHLGGGGGGGGGGVRIPRRRLSYTAPYSTD